MSFNSENMLRRYRLTSPAGEVFEAAILYDDATTGIMTFTNRGGEWHADDTIRPADLIMPEYELNEWDVERIPLGGAANDDLRS